MNKASNDNKAQLGVLLKPDALLENKRFPFDQFCDCLLSINSILKFTPPCTIDNFFLPSSTYAHKGVIKQISERSLSEPSFSLPILNRLSIKHLISDKIEEIIRFESTFSLSEIICELITVFTFKIESCNDFIFDNVDCFTIYSSIFEKEVQLFRSLQLYLENRHCRIYFLSGNQSLTAVEYIKTFVRYFFKYRQGEKHRLENYLHALNEVETKYFLEKFTYLS